MGESRLLKVLSIWIAAELVLLGALLFVPAGTWHFWQAWLLLAVFFVPSIPMVIHLLRRAPDLVRRRLQREKTPLQRALVSVLSFFFAVLFLTAGCDRRYHWSHVPTVLVIVADAVVLLGLLLSFWVMEVNRYASTAVQLMPEQHVITTGPYAYVRHPMYTSGLLIAFALPFALGSYWAIPARRGLAAPGRRATAERREGAPRRPARVRGVLPEGALAIGAGDLVMIRGLSQCCLLKGCHLPPVGSAGLDSSHNSPLRVASRSE